MQSEKLQKHFRRTHFGLRFGMGLLTFLFPILLIGFGHYHDGLPLPTELSAYYWLGASDLRPFPLRELFVGPLWALGCFRAFVSRGCRCIGCGDLPDESTRLVQTLFG
jgi:hypothetical protein